MSLLFMSRHMKVIQDALLYNKIECYNEGVQRSPSCSAKGYTLLEILKIHKSCPLDYGREKQISFLSS